MSIELRKITSDELEPYIRADAYGFGYDVESLDDVIESDKKTIQLERVLCMFEGANIVGAVASHGFEMSVPSATLPVGAITNAFVFPTHRRQGHLTKMMRMQLDEIHERGEILSALSASESVIYERFGFGVGIFRDKWDIERHHTSFAHAPEWKGRTRFIAPGEIKGIFPDLHERATENRPGVVQPPSWEWDRIEADPPGPFRREGTPFFHVLYEEDGRPDGYVTYRLRGDDVVVFNLMAATEAAHAALWRYCFDIDLKLHTEAWNRPTDDPIYWMLADPRRLKNERQDFIWLRLVDVPAALSSRRYMTDDSLVMEIKDSFCPWNEGRYELVGSPDGAECIPTSKNADIVLSAADLANVYLGTTSFTPLARAGRIEERTKGALLRASNMFAVELQPWCPFNF